MWVDDLAFEAALLPLEAGRVVPAGRLVEAVWRGNPPPGAAKTLQSYVSRLRAALEPDVAQALVLVARRGLAATLTSRRRRPLCVTGRKGDAAGLSCKIRSTKNTEYKVPTEWPALPYDAWSATCDTLHAHTQVLGKLAAALAPSEPQLQHTALRLTVRGWETLPLPAPDGSGALAVALDLRTHQVVAEHSDGRAERVALTPDRPVADVTREVLAAVGALAGPVQINPRPQEVPWNTPLDEDEEHATYDPAHVSAYFAAATRAALVLSALRAPYRGRCSPVNAWWGSFDLAVSLFSGQPAEPASGELHHA